MQLITCCDHEVFRMGLHSFHDSPIVYNPIPLFVFRLLFDAIGLAVFVGLESRVDYLGDLVILALVVDGQRRKSESHPSLVHVLELAHGLQEEVVLVRAIVTNVDKDFPRLQDGMSEL